MAKIENTTEALSQYGQGFTQYAKDAAAIQLKAAQLFLDQSVKLSQTFAEFYQTQATESLKLTQACVATGKELASEVRRQVGTYTEKATTSI
ncbi:MAG: hypothetical protein V4760_06400 [Bdellovibrionota bacterium]